LEYDEMKAESSKTRRTKKVELRELSRSLNRISNTLSTGFDKIGHILNNSSNSNKNFVKTNESLASSTKLKKMPPMP